MGTLQQTGDAETEDEGEIRAGVHSEGTRKWSVPRRSRRARETTIDEYGSLSRSLMIERNRVASELVFQPFIRTPDPPLHDERVGTVREEANLHLTSTC